MTLSRRLLVFTKLIALAFTSCAIPFDGEHGEVHHLVLGFGVVSVANESTSGAIVTDARALGLAFSNLPGNSLTLGYGATTTTLVPDGAEDVRMEVENSLFGSILIHAHAAHLAQGEK